MSDIDRRAFVGAAAVGGVAAAVLAASSAIAAGQSGYFVIAEIVSKKDKADELRALMVPFEKGSFMNAVGLAMGGMQGVPQELIDEQLPLFGVNIDPKALRPKRALFLERVNAHLEWLAEVLADGRKFILGKDPSAADLCAYHPIWFARQNGGSEVNDLIAFAGVIDPWFERVTAIGHGKFAEMTADQAIEAAKKYEPTEPNEWLPEAQDVGLERGDWVSVTPDDYGNPVYGSLLAWTADEVVIRHEDPSVGKVNLHFPRVGFDTVPAQRKAA